MEIKAKVYLDRAFWFCDRDTIESVITFRIDSRTIKRGSHSYHVDRVPLGLIHVHMHFDSRALTLTFEID
jgi:hypothetical protein